MAENILQPGHGIPNIRSIGQKLPKTKSTRNRITPISSAFFPSRLISVGAIDQIIDTALHDTERYNRQAKHSEQNIDQTIILGSYHIQLFGIFPETEYTPDTAGQKGQQQISDSCIIFSCTVIDITEYLYPGNQIVNAAGYNRQHDNTK